VLLARLGVDVREQGQGLGAALLKDAIQRASVAAKSVGGRALLVHAKHDRTRSFYEHFDFEPSPTDPLQMFILLDGVTP
jgi:Acetyltransferase (GNAT) family.